MNVIISLPGIVNNTRSLSKHKRSWINRISCLTIRSSVMIKCTQHLTSKFSFLIICIPVLIICIQVLILRIPTLMVNTQTLINHFHVLGCSFRVLMGCLSGLITCMQALPPSMSVLIVNCMICISYMPRLPSNFASRYIKLLCNSIKPENRMQQLKNSRTNF